jgi:hypothetical protein
MNKTRATTVAVEKQKVLQTLSCVCNIGIQHAMCMRHIVISGPCGCTIFFHLIP